MVHIDRILTGPYGGLVVGVFVMLLEEIIRRLILGRPNKDRQRTSSVTQQAAVGGDGNITQTVDNSRLIIIQRLTGETRSQQAPRIPRQGGQDDDDTGMVVLVLLGTALACIALTVVLGRYATVIANIATGVGLATAFTALSAAVRLRRAGEPVGRWAGLGIISGASLCLTGPALRGARWQSLDISDLRTLVHGKGFKDSVGAVWHTYGMDGASFFAMLLLGVVVLLFAAIASLVPLTGMVAAQAALSRQTPRQWHVWLVARLYPRGSATITYLVVMVWISVGLALASGRGHDWLAHLQQWEMRGASGAVGGGT